MNTSPEKLLLMISIPVFLFVIPVLFLLMLPSLIFSNDGLSSVSGEALNDTSIILDNISDAESCIEKVLRTKHDALLTEIQNEGNALGENCEYSIVDEFADQIIYESTLLISQFCASQDNYNQINLRNLESMLSDNTDNIFSYTVVSSSYETTDEETGETDTIHHYTYTVEYAGDAYFAQNVFHLTDKQTELAEEYAANLHLFLFDTVYFVELNNSLIAGETGSSAVTYALSKLGTPYSQERRNEDGYFDCSSFTYWVYRQLGITLQYDGANTAAAQGRYIVENNLAISYDSLAPGDLVFYNFGVNNRYMNIGHVGIYAGNGYIIDASSSKGKVVYRSIYNTNNIVLCGRPYTE